MGKTCKHEVVKGTYGWTSECDNCGINMVHHWLEEEINENNELRAKLAAADERIEELEKTNK